MTLIVGLTGGIGSGKTVASDHFAKLGAPVIDTDIIARQVVEPGQATLQELCLAFGKEILGNDGELDRNALRKIAFSNPSNKNLLDSITHPAIRKETARQIEMVDAHYCIVVIPLLSKNSAFFELMSRVAVVVADQETRIKRVMQRSQLSREETLAILQSQISDNERLDFADDVINNDGTIEEAQKTVEKLDTFYLSFDAVKN